SQESPFWWLPSSHSSPGSWLPSPQKGTPAEARWQVASQGLPGAPLLAPSSHSSSRSASSTPLPQPFAVQSVSQEEPPWGSRGSQASPGETIPSPQKPQAPCAASQTEPAPQVSVTWKASPSGSAAQRVSACPSQLAWKLAGSHFSPGTPAQDQSPRSAD